MTITEQTAYDQQAARTASRSSAARANATAERRTLLHEVARLNRKCAELQAKLQEVNK